MWNSELRLKIQPRPSRKTRFFPRTRLRFLKTERKRKQRIFSRVESEPSRRGAAAEQTIVWFLKSGSSSFPGRRTGKLASVEPGPKKNGVLEAVLQQETEQPKNPRTSRRKKAATIKCVYKLNYNEMFGCVSLRLLMISCLLRRWDMLMIRVLIFLGRRFEDESPGLCSSRNSNESWMNLEGVIEPGGAKAVPTGNCQARKNN